MWKAISRRPGGDCSYGARYSNQRGRRFRFRKGQSYGAARRRPGGVSGPEQTVRSLHGIVSLPVLTSRLTLLQTTSVGRVPAQANGTRPRRLMDAILDISTTNFYGPRHSIVNSQKLAGQGCPEFRCDTCCAENSELTTCRENTFYSTRPDHQFTLPISRARTRRRQSFYRVFPYNNSS